MLDFDMQSKPQTISASASRQTCREDRPPVRQTWRAGQQRLKSSEFGFSARAQLLLRYVHSKAELEAVHFDKTVDAYKKAEVRCMLHPSDPVLDTPGRGDGGTSNGEGLSRLAVNAFGPAMPARGPRESNCM